MPDSSLRSFVNGTRAMLSAQLIVAVLAIALAGWTLSVTNRLIRERDRLQERVIQLEETMAARGAVPPPPAAVVERVQPASGDVVYPGSTTNAIAAEAAEGEAASTIVAHAPAQSERDLGSIVSSLFGPAPALRTIVLHARGEEDAVSATRIARALQQSVEGAQVLVAVAAPGAQRQPGYVYFDGRQSRAAADAVARFHDTARDLQIAQWSAQLRGAALPAQGEYTADRLDIILPALPPPPAAVEAPVTAATPE